MTVNSNSDSTREEIAYILRFSRISFDAFRFKSDRMKQWGFLTIVLAIEKKWSVEQSDLFNSKEMAELIDHRADKYYHVHRRIKAFKNEYGPLLSTKGADDSKSSGSLAKENKEKKVYHLTKYFDAAVDLYVNAFLNEMIPPNALPTQIDRLTSVQKRMLIKEIHKFQVQRYLPNWSKLVDGIADTASTYGVNTTALKNVFRNHLEHGIVMILLFDEFLRDPAASLDIYDLSEKVVKVMGRVRPDEITKSVRFLSRKNGCRILDVVKTKGSGSARYRLNENYRSRLEAYALELPQLRSELVSHVVNQLK